MFQDQFSLKVSNKLDSLPRWKSIGFSGIRRHRYVLPGSSENRGHQKHRCPDYVYVLKNNPPCFQDTCAHACSHLRGVAEAETPAAGPADAQPRKQPWGMKSDCCPPPPPIFCNAVQNERLHWLYFVLDHSWSQILSDLGEHLEEVPTMSQ